MVSAGRLVPRESRVLMAVLTDGLGAVAARVSYGICGGLELRMSCGLWVSWVCLQLVYSRRRFGSRCMFCAFLTILLGRKPQD